MPNKSTFSSLIEALIESGNEGDVSKVVLMAVSSGVIDNDSWHFFVNRIVNNLDSGATALDRLLVENAT